MFKLTFPPFWRQQLKAPDSPKGARLESIRENVRKKAINCLTDTNDIYSDIIKNDNNPGEAFRYLLAYLEEFRASSPEEYSLGWVKTQFVKAVEQFMADTTHPIFKANEYKKFKVLKDLFESLNPASSFNTFGHFNLANIALSFNSEENKIYVIGTEIPEFLQPFEPTFKGSIDEVPPQATIVFTNQTTPIYKGKRDKYQIWTTNPQTGADIQFRGERIAYVNPKEPTLAKLRKFLATPSGYPVSFLAENIVDSFTGTTSVPEPSLPETDPKLNDTEVFLSEIYNSDKQKRQEATRDRIFALHKQHGIQGIVKFIEELKAANWYGVYKKSVNESNFNDLRTVLQIEFDMYEAIKWAIFDIKIPDEWIEMIKKRLPDIGSQNFSFTTAGLPKNFPIVSRFKIFCNQLMSDPAHPVLKDDKNAKRKLLQDNLDKLAKEVFPDFHSYSTYSTTNAFHLARASERPKRHFYYKKSEYTPMLSSLDKDEMTEFQFFEVERLCISNPFYSKPSAYSPDLSSLDKEDEPKIEFFDFERHDNAQPSAILFSSIPRSGILRGRFSVTTVTNLRRDPNTELWVDCAQDSRLLGSNSSNYGNKKDVIFFSKRLGDSGRGFTLSVKERETLTDPTDSYPIEFIAANFASIFALHSHRAYTPEDLLTQPSIIEESRTIPPEHRASSIYADTRRVISSKLSIQEKYGTYIIERRGYDPEHDAEGETLGVTGGAFHEGEIVLFKFNKKIDINRVVAKLEQKGIVVDVFPEENAFRIRITAFDHPDSIVEFQKRLDAILSDPNLI